MSFVVLPRQPFPVADETAMLALVFGTDVFIGDEVIHEDSKNVYMLVDDTPSDIDSWKRLDGGSDGGPVSGIPDDGSVTTAKLAASPALTIPRSNLDTSTLASLTKADTAVQATGPGGTIDPLLLPALAISDTFDVDSQAEMLALDAQKGDIARRSDIGSAFVLQGEDPSILGNWIQLDSGFALTVDLETETAARIAGDAAKASITELGARANTVATAGDSITAQNGAALSDLPMPRVTNLATTGVTSGGSVPVGTWYYTVVPSISGNITPGSGGDGPACTNLAVTTTSGNQTVPLTWSAPTGIPASLTFNLTYKIYRSTTRDNFPSSGALVASAVTTTNYTDTSATTSAGVPAIIGNQTTGYMMWAQVFSGHRLRSIGNFGIGTQTTTQLLARIDEVVAANPGICIVNIGVNDVNGGVSTATITSNITSIVTALRNAGITVVLCTIGPSVNANTSAKQLVAMQSNAFIRNYAQTTPGVYLADTAAATVSPSSATAQYASGMSSDGLHPLGQGAAYMGAVIARTLNSFVREIDTLPDTNGDNTNGFFYLSTNNDPMLTGSVSSTPPYSGLANFFSATTITSPPTNVTFSVVAADAADPHKANWQRVAISAAASGSSNYIRIQPADLTLAAWGISPGDTVYAECEFRNPLNDWSGITRIDLELAPLDASSSNALSPNAQDGGNISSGALPSAQISGGRLKTPRIILPTSTNKLRLYLFLGGATMTAAGTIDIRRFALRKV